MSANGTVTGVVVGTATITATSKSFFGGTTTTTYTVVVTEGMTDLVLGVGWSSAQSDFVFDAYKKIATNKTYDYSKAMGIPGIMNSC